MQRLLASVLAMSLLSSCYYFPEQSGTRFSSSYTERRKVRVGYQLRAFWARPRFLVRNNPICTEFDVGTFSAQDYTVRQRKQSRAGMIAPTILSAGMSVGAYFILGTEAAPAGYILMPLGLSLLLASTIGLMLPSKLERKQAKDTKPAATVSIAEDAEWKVCGTGDPAPDVGVSIEVAADNGTSLTIHDRTGSDGTVRVPDIRRWATSCGLAKFTMTVTAYVTDNSKVTAETLSEVAAARSRFKGIDRLSYDSDRMRYLEQKGYFSDTKILEVGDQAGTDTPIVLHKESVSWKFAPTENVDWGASVGGELARSCDGVNAERAAELRAAARERCFAPQKSAATSTCRASCDNPAKRQECELTRDICVEDRMGIQGTATQECGDALKRCLQGYGLTDSAMASCTDRCVQSAFDKACP